MNTVMGLPEPKFREIWLQKLWIAMAKTGKGYRHGTAQMKRDGRRKDKIGTTKLSRFLAQQRSIAR